jgi:protein required for attachment to host cells
LKALIVVARPKIPAELRPAFSKEVQALIAAGDLTHHTIPEIEKLLAAHDM